MRAKTLLCSIILFALVCFTSGDSLSQSKERFDPDGSFWIIGTPPDEFSDYGNINLNARGLRRLPAPGLQLNDGKTFRYKTLTVRRERFTFTTVARAGVSYSFAGRFLRGGVFQAAELDEQTPVLEGTLTKYKFGKKVAEASLKFSYFGGT
jgi:hypothetical protein